MFTDIIVLASQHSKDNTGKYYSCRVIINADSFADAFEKAGQKIKQEAHKSRGVIHAEVWALKHCNFTQGASYWHQIADFEYNVNEEPKDVDEGTVLRTMDREAMLQHAKERSEEAALSHKQFEEYEAMESTQTFTDDGNAFTDMWTELPPELRDQLNDPPETPSQHSKRAPQLQHLPRNVQEIVNKWDRMSQESKDMVHWLADRLVDHAKPETSA